MHPLIARFLDFPTAIATLDKDGEATLDSFESALLGSASEFPKIRSTILKARGSSRPSVEAQQQLLVLSARAAVRRICVDPVLGPLVVLAKAALQREGASAAEADDLIAQAVLEEAFGYGGDPNVFDSAFLAETLHSISHLALVTQETVDEWLDAFARGGAPGDRPLRLKAAELLLENAWGQGPEPITPEHLDDAIEQLGDAVARPDWPKATQALGEFLSYLSEKQIIGEQRRARLAHLLLSATSTRPEVETEEGHGDDEAEE